MYNLSPRMGEVVHSQTTDLVGPNTYVLCNPPYETENFCPFLSCTPRVSSFIPKCFTEAIYDVSGSHKSTVKGGSSLRNKGQRFVYKIDDLPSPTHYNPKRPGKGIKREPVSKGNFWRAVCTSDISCPSIPGKADVNGYRLENGRLFKVPPDEHDTTLGPAFYSVDAEEFYKKRYGGCKWSAYRSQRVTLKVHEGPGPAHYMVKSPACAKSDVDEQYREMSRLLTFLPRFSEAQELRTNKEGLPGPGTYEAIIRKDSTRSKSIKPRPFITAKKRFQYIIPDFPSPGDYEIVDVDQKKDISLSDAPFGTDCPRFPSKVPPETPGPATYTMKSPLLEQVRSKKNRYSLVYPAFNGTSERKIDNAAPDAECTPSSADYIIRKEDTQPSSVHSSVFRSVVPRFIQKKDQDRMGPAKYNIVEQFNKNKNRISHNVGKVPFLTTGPRSTFARVKYITPGPGQYISKKSKKQEGYYFRTTPRFDPDPEPRPGPTSYNIHPSYERSIYKAYNSHNIRLKESILKEKLRLPPCETFDRWAQQLKTSKQLRCFSDKFYMHCDSP